jgi:uncharacterized repeat protein (TIGR03847 family)
MPVFEYDAPERFVAGTVGAPGDRTFFLQVSAGTRVTSVSLEKQQVAVLAERVEELLDELFRRTGGDTAVPAVAPLGATDNEPLTTPVEEDFRVGTMSLAWDGDTEQVVIECLEVGQEAGADGDLTPATADASLLRVRLTGAAARAFVQRSEAVLAAGRPPCPFCGNPLDPEGHICPRANGHRR